MMTDGKRCVVSGIGLATPAGCDLDTFWAALAKGASLFQPRHIYGDDGPVVQVSVVDDAALNHELSRRQSRKLDRFTLLAIAAIRQALRDATIEITDDIRDRIGMIIGNATAGWTFVESVMYSLYVEGMDTVNPYVATAWFPAAPQGEASILLGLGGYSKTVSADRLSSGIALEQSVRLILAERADIVLAGGAEAPLNALVFNSYLRREKDGKRMPRLGEGAVFLVVEDEQRARARNSKIYAHIAGIGKGRSLADSMPRALQMGRVGITEVGHVFLDARDGERGIAAECQIIDKIFDHPSDLSVSAPKSMYGDLVGADMAADIAIGCLALARQTVLPTAGDLEHISGDWHLNHVLGQPATKALKYLLVNGRDAYGQSMSILLGSEVSAEVQ